MVPEVEQSHGDGVSRGGAKWQYWGRSSGIHSASTADTPKMQRGGGVSKIRLVNSRRSLHLQRPKMLKVEQSVCLSREVKLNVCSAGYKTGLSLLSFRIRKQKNDLKMSIMIGLTEAAGANCVQTGTGKFVSTPTAFQVPVMSTCLLPEAALTFHVHLGGLHDLLVDDKLWQLFEQRRGGMDEHWLVHERSLREGKKKEMKPRRRDDGDPTDSKPGAILQKDQPYMHSSISGPRCLLPARAWQDDLPARPAQSAAGKPPDAPWVEPSSDSQRLPPLDRLRSLQMEIRN